MFGRPIKFQALGDFAYITSDDPLIQHHTKGVDAVLVEIDRGIREGQGGVIEITAAQYENEFVKKKASSNSSPASKPHWREEIRADMSPDTLAPKLDQVARPVVGSKAPAADPDAPVNAATPARSLRERANLNR